MSKYHVDRDTEYMYKMWGTTSLITDYWTKPHKTSDAAEELTDEEQNQESVSYTHLPSPRDRTRSRMPSSA